jgi:PAS domain S-box-containing protein
MDAPDAGPLGGHEAHRKLEESALMRGRTLRRLAVLATAAATLALALVAWQAAERQTHAEARRAFDFRVEEMANDLAGRMLDYEQVLRGAVGLLAASSEISAERWRTYVYNLRLESSYPGIQALAYAPLLRQDGGAAMPVRFIEPHERGNTRVLGFDLLRDGERRRAAERARDTGTPVLTGPVRLISEESGSTVPGFLVMVPVFAGATPETVAERRERFIAVVYAAFRATDFFEGTLGRRVGLQVRLLDVTAANAPAVLYDDRLEAPRALFEKAQRFGVRGRSWQLQARSLPPLESEISGDRPRLVLGAGLALAVLFTALVWSLVNTRRQAGELARRMVAANEERDRFRAAVDLHVDTMLMVDAASARIVYANEGAARSLGYSRDELVGEPASMVFADRDQPRLVAEYGRLAESGEAVEMERVRFRRKDGTVFPVEVTRQVLRTGGKAFILGVGRDITARLEAERSLRESEARLALSLESSGLALFDWDLSTGLVHLGKEWQAMLGGEPSATVTPIQKLEQLVHKDDLPALLEQVRALVAGEIEIYRVEHRVRMLNGQWKWIESVAKVSRRDRNGRATRVTGTNADITDRKAVSELKNAFIANVSHELRTPLTGIVASLELLKEGAAGELPPQARRFIELAHGNGERLADLISDILDLERIESGRLHLEIEKVAVHPVLEQVAELNSAYVARHKARIEVRAPAEGLAVSADRDRLVQVLTNLVSNAAKFSPEGGAIRLQAAAKRDRVVLSVSDEGPGIPDEFRARLFGKFEQADHDKAGTGLGLAISKAMVEKMGGHIACISAPGQGATFTLDLPAA